MHRLAAMPGGWNPGQDGVIFVEQSSAPIIILTAADTDIQSIAVAQAQLPEDFPPVRAVNLLQLQQQLTIDTYADDILSQATVIVLRLLGGQAYWPYGLEVIKEIVQQTQATLFVVPGDTQPDPTLISHSTAQLSDVDQLWHYFIEGGTDNMVSALQFISDTCLGSEYKPSEAIAVPRVGRYELKAEGRTQKAEEPIPRPSQEATAYTLVKNPFNTRIDPPKSPLKRGTSNPDFDQKLPRSSDSLLNQGGLGGSVQSFEGVSEMCIHGSSQTGNRSIDTPQRPNAPTPQRSNSNPTSNLQPPTSNIARVGILFYRSHYLSGNLGPIDALCEALRDRHLTPIPLFISSLRDADVQSEMLAAFLPKDGPAISVLLNTTSFSAAKLDRDAPDVEVWRSLNVPVLQVILSSGTQEQWQSNWQGLLPRDIAMNVALPEVDGRIISRAISFKAVQTRNAALETDVVAYEAVGDRIQFVADLAQSWVILAQTPPEERRIALILANYPNRDGRIANGVGLDTPESCVRILRALQQDGYDLGPLDHQNEQDTAELKSMGYASLNHSTGGIFANGDELIYCLTKGFTNDPEAQELRPVAQSLLLEDYLAYFEGLPKAVQQGVCDRWGPPKSKIQNLPTFIPSLKGNRSTLPKSKIQNPKSKIPVAGLQFGNIFVGIQPSRGYDRDPSLNYHAPDLEPTHDYLAFYHWLRKDFGVHAIVHVGKHGNLEWLPGKGMALTQTCYPEIALGPLPHLYPFIVNDPGEGAQAKRRSQAVIIDHLTPPMTRAELYGPLLKLESLIDEYYDAQSMDPTRVPILRDRIFQLIDQEKLQLDLQPTPQLPNCSTSDSKLQNPPAPSPSQEEKSTPNPCQEGEQNIQHPTSNIQHLIARADGYLCELKEAQIRDGLHIFGQCPDGQQLRDLVVAIARHPHRNSPGLTRAIADAWGVEFDPLTTDVMLALDLTIINPNKIQPEAYAKRLFGCRNHGEAIALIEEYAAEIVDELIAITSKSNPSQERDRSIQNPKAKIQNELEHIRVDLLPKLYATCQESTHLLHGLNGGYVPSGGSGAPTRGRTEVLPTGRNFYSVDIRAIPTESAWDVGRKAAETLIERYTQEHGDYPKTLGLSIWGTATMRTGGDAVAEALALLGVQPVWDGPSRRVVDFEIVPVPVLGRPRVDVTLRISGFFRDAFANLIDLFHRAVEGVTALDEAPEDNPLAAQVFQEQEHWLAQGLTVEQAEARSRYRIFGSKPGAYGAGLQGLIEAQNWTDEEDLARAYINWSSYAYTGQGNGKSAPEAFDQRLRHMEVVLHNQDNREHDLLDSDDYYQFQGGLTAAVRSRRGKAPTLYFGDHSIPEKPRVRHLKEEIARVYRSRVVNPKWIEGVMRHGYKGAFEMAATVDYLFAYDATTHCAEDHMYEGVAKAYLLDEDVQTFVQGKNPWALRDMSERLLEAHQRGLWQEVEQTILDDLRALVHKAEAIVETHTDSLG